MNHVYRLVWKTGLSLWQAVPETARSHGKPTSVTRAAAHHGGDHIVGALQPAGRSGPSAWRWKPRLGRLLALPLLALPALAAAQGIVPDGRTQTTVSANGPVANVTTATVRGHNAFNSFSVFDVGQGQTANLFLPGGALNLINLVRDQRTTIDGIVNAIKGGQIGGHVYFANPYGFLIGAGGVVNVGSLSLSTPTAAFVDAFFSSAGHPDDAAVGALLRGTAPRNRDGAISVLGKINAIDGVALSAGAIDVGGTVYSGARFVGSAPDFTDVVNANGLVSATNVVVRAGRVEIVADGDVAVSGTIAAPGGAGVRGGDIAIRSGANVDLQAGAVVAARGNGEASAGGQVDIRAGHDAVARKTALADASAGVGGDGGAIEFGAANTVELAGGEFRADGTGGGKAGSVRIDPANIVVSADLLRGAAGYGVLPAGASAAGANLTLQADDAITVNAGVTVSTRSVAGTSAADHAGSASTGDSGNLALQAATIALKPGSRLLAGTEAGSSWCGGDVLLEATRATQALPAEARISVDHATVTGRNVALGASASWDDSRLAAWLPVSVPSVTAAIDVDAGRIEASGTLNLGATARAVANSSGVSPLGSIETVSSASVDVRGAAVLTAGGNTLLAAQSTVTAKAAPGGPNPASLPGDAGVAVNVVASTAKVHLGDSSSITVSSGTLDLSAKNAVTATTQADATAGGAVAVGGTVAVSEISSVTQAVIDGSATTSSATLGVAAESTQAVTTSAKAAPGGAKKQSADEQSAAPSRTEQTLAKYKDQATTSDGSVEVAAAVAVANVDSVTQADIASTGTQTASDAATVSSSASTTSAVTADGSSAGGGVGVGAAVGINVGVLVNEARVADNASVGSSGLTVHAGMPAASRNSFVTTATSGAGASDVGVAGALATNVLVNTTFARIEGDRDGSGSGAAVDAHGGDVVVESANTSESRVTSGASVKPATATEPAAVGIGASIGVNVAVNTTVAEAGDGSAIVNGKDFRLDAGADHTLATEVSGGAAGAKVAVTPLVATTIAVNTTTARLGESASTTTLAGKFSSSAQHQGSATTTATGQTEGSDVAVGASLGLTVATDTVASSVERDLDAAQGVDVKASSTAKSSTTATASAKGGEKARDDGSAPAPEGGSGSGQSVDQKVAAQGDAARTAGKKTAAAAPPAASDATSDAAAKLDGVQAAPKTEDATESGGVAVAAAVGVNVGVATTTARVGEGRRIGSSAGALAVESVNQTDAAAKSDGSQVDPGNTDVGVGAAVALNVGIATNTAVVGENAVIGTKGLTIRAVHASGEKSDFSAEAKSGAGAKNVGVAGSLAANVVVSTTVAVLEGDTAGDADAKGAVVDAGGADIAIEAANATTSSVKSGADVKGTDDKAKVGIGASIGVNVAVNTTVAEAGDGSAIVNGKDFRLDAGAHHTLATEVSGGAAGAKVAVTPLVAATIAVNTTTARLGESAATTTLAGKFSSSAQHQGSATTTATGQTEGSDVAVGASLGLTVATDTVASSVERDLDAAQGVDVKAGSTAKSSTTATASAKGGEKAKDDGSAPAPEGGSGSGQSVDQQVAAQQGKAKGAGKATAAKAPATTPAAGGTASEKLDANEQTPPKGETSEGGVSVAAAIGVNVGVATTTARVGAGKRITSSAGALEVESVNQTDTAAKADGSQVDSSKSADIGVGAALALNVGVATTTAVVADEAAVSTQGLTIRAAGATGEKSDSSADAKSGAGAANVGVAGALAINVATNSTVARLEGDADHDGSTASVDARGGAVRIEAASATTSTAKVSADVKGSDDKAKVGVGASVGVNVGVHTTVAEVGDGAVLTGAGSVGLDATADHAMSTEATGGAAGAKVSVTPVVAATIAVDTTAARLGNAATALDASGAYSGKAEQQSTITTKATGQAQGDVAVGASLGATIAVDEVSATVERDLDAARGVALGAKSDTSLTTEVKAGAKGAEAAKKDAGGNETPETGTTVDEQKKTQLDFARSRNGKAAGVDTTTPEAKTPDTTEEAPGTDKPTGAPDNEKKGKKISVAAAIGATVAYNQASAAIAAGKTVGAGSGKLELASTTDTNYRTLASGEAVSDEVGVAAAVALTATYNQTRAEVGRGATISDAGDVEVSATSRQNRGTDFQKATSAEAVSGAGGGEVAVAGSLAAVGNWNETRASIDEGVTIGSAGAPVGDVSVGSDETSKVAAQARAGALSKGDQSKAGIGASFAVVLSTNHDTAAVGYDADQDGNWAPTSVHADSLTVTATRNRVGFLAPTAGDAANFSAGDIEHLDFDALDPSHYLGSNNSYTEAVAGAAAKGKLAVAGAFAVNLFGNAIEAYLGPSVNVTASGRQPAGERLGVEVAAHSDTQAISFTGSVAGAKKAGVGISATSIVNLDQTRATIGDGSVVRSNADGAGVSVNAYARHDLANVGVSAALATEGAGVTGVLGAIVSLAETEAKIGDAAEVKSRGDIGLAASGDITAVSVAGGVAGGKNAGVGASIAANVLANSTRAVIGAGADVAATNDVDVAADAGETAITAVVAGAGGGKVGVAAALSANVIVGSTEALVGQGARINTDAAYDGGSRSVNLTARDGSVVVGIAGSGAGGGKAGVGAALDTTVLVKTVRAAIEDDADGLDTARVNADRDLKIDASATESLTSVSMGFAGGGNVGVGGAVSVAVDKNDVQAGVGKWATVDSDGNVLINAQDDVVAVLTAGAGAGGGDAGVGASLAVATLLGSSKAYVGDGTSVNARGNAAAQTVYSGETVFSDTDSAPSAFAERKTESAKGLSVTAYNREDLVTTVVAGAGGGTAGVAATVSANVIASTTEASIGRDTKVNHGNAGAGAEQQVRVKAIDETLLIDTALAAAGGGTAGVGGTGNVGVIVKTTTARVGKGAQIEAKKAFELTAASADLTVAPTAGFAGGGTAGVGGAIAANAVANTTQAYVEDGTGATDRAKIVVSGGDLDVGADEFSSAWVTSGTIAGGGTAGIGGALSIGVNASTTRARIGAYTETDASGATSVEANSTENVNSIAVAGGGGGVAGVVGSVSVDVVVSATEAGIGDHARVNQDAAITSPDQSVDVSATDRVISVAAAGAGAGGGAAGVGGAAAVTVALNTTTAYIDHDAVVSAAKDVGVHASSTKAVNSATIAGAGGGTAGVAGAVSVLAVGSLLDGDANGGLQSTGSDGSSTTTQAKADAATGASPVGGALGTSKQSTQTKTEVDRRMKKLAVSDAMSSSAPVPQENAQASIGAGARVDAGRDVAVSASDQTLAVNANGAGAGGGAVGVAGSLGVTLLHDSAAAFIAGGARVDADRTVSVKAETGETVVNVGVTGYGGGAAGVGGSAAVNVVTSNTSAYIGAAAINQGAHAGAGRAVEVTAAGNSNLFAVAGSGGGAGAAAVGGVLNVNTLAKSTRAFIGEGAAVSADTDVIVAAESAQNIVSAGISLQGAGAAAVGGAATVNVVDNRTEAFIGSARDDQTKTAATVDSDGNVVVAASDDTLLIAVSGSGTGAGAAAVGGAVGANVVSSRTRAWVGDRSVVDARGNAAGAKVATGTIDNASAGAMPSLPDGVSGDIDADRDGVKDGDIASGANFTLAGGGTSTGVDPSSVKDSSGNRVGNALGGLGARGTETARGLSVTATGNEKIVTAAMGVAGAGAAGVTGTATADIIVSTTEAGIGDSARINQGAGVFGDRDVRVRAADNSFIVMASGTVAGAAGAGISGSANVAVVAKNTHATIGDADVKARDVVVGAASAEDLYVIDANVSFGAAGIGGAAGVAVVTNRTEAGIAAGAGVDAGGGIAIRADQDTSLDIYTIAGSAGIGAVSGAFSIGVIDNTTRAFVGAGTSAATGATLDAGGAIEVAAGSTERITTGTASAAGGGAGFAGSVGVKVVTSQTTAEIGDYAQVDQTRRGGASQDVVVDATDTVELGGGGGSGAVGALFGAGATAEVNVVRNTTTASIGNHAKVRADHDLRVAADSTKDVAAQAYAMAGGGFAGVSGAVSLAFVGASIESDRDARSGIGDGATAAKADEKMKADNVAGKLGSNEHVQDTKSQISTRTAGLGVADELGDQSSQSLDKTRAFVGHDAELIAGRRIDVTATDRTQIDLQATGAGFGIGGIGAAIGIGVTHSTTEAFVDRSTVLEAAADATIAATATNVGADGSSVTARSGAGGVVGISAAVAVLDDTSTARAYVGDHAEIRRAATFGVQAETSRKSATSTFGAAAGGISVGGAVARTSFGGTTTAYLDHHASIGKSAGKTVGNVDVGATDASLGIATATAGSAGIASGAGADASAKVNAGVDAHIATGADIEAAGDVTVAAVATPAAQAQAIGVSAGAAAVGVSIAEATVTSGVTASLGADSSVEAGHLNVRARRLLPGSGATARADSLAASGGLIGASGSVAGAKTGGTTIAGIGNDAAITGSVEVLAETNTRQVADASGLAVGIVAAGANDASAASTTTTHAVLGDDVNVAAGMFGSIAVNALGTDRNQASATAGSGGVVAGSAASATTKQTSDTLVETGKSSCGEASATCGMVAGTFQAAAEHDSVYNAKVDSTTAAVAGASGSTTEHDVHSAVTTRIGDAVKVTANAVELAARNASHKFWWGQSSDDNSTATADDADWNVNAGSGGLFSLPAASTRTDISHQTKVELGASEVFHVVLPASGTGAFDLDALNTIVAYDKVKLDSGGAIALAASDTRIGVTRNDALVVVGAGTAISSDSGDIDIGSRNDVKLDARAVANAYGLAGAPSGTAYIDYTGNSATRVLGGALLLATDASHGAVHVFAGDDSQQRGSSIAAHTAVNLWNKTLFPINSTPDARTRVTQDASVDVAAAGNVLAAGDIGLAADRGRIGVSAVGIGKDLYREALAAIASVFGIDASFDITGGSAPTPGGTAQVNVDGTVLSGLLRQSATQVDVEIVSPARTEEDAPSWRLVYSRIDSRSQPSLAPNPLDPTRANPFITSVHPPQVVESDVAPDSRLQARIDLLYKLKRDYAADPVASAAYDAEIRFLENKLGPQGIGQNSSPLTPRGSAAIDAAGVANDALLTRQALITGDITAATPSAQIGAVGSLVGAYLSIDANNTLIDTHLTGMKNADPSDTDYVRLNQNRSDAASAYGDLRSQTAAIGNYAYACLAGDPGCTTPSGPLGSYSSTVRDGVRSVAGSGLLEAIQNDVKNISLLALKGDGATGTLVSNVQDLSSRMNAVKNANAAIVTAAGDIHRNLATAATHQATLSESWRDTADSDNVDTDRVSAVAALVGTNDALIARFDDGVNGTPANLVKTQASSVAGAAGTVAAAVATVTNASDATVPGSRKLITLPDIAVKLGNVDVRADILSGTGTVEAPGDARIWIVSNAPASIDIGNLTVDSEGGNVRLNGFMMNDAGDLRRFNPSYTGAVPTIVSRQNGAAGSPEIRIVSNYDPSGYSFTATDPARRVPAPAPDLTLGYLVDPLDPVKRIANPNGIVSVASAAGDVYVDGAIVAGSISVLARNGDFVQKYVNGFNAVAGEPSDNVQGGPNVLPPGNTTPPGLGMVANGNIFISARYLNINGLVQSGIVNYHLDIPSDAALRFVLPKSLWAGYIGQCGGASCTLNLPDGGSVTYESWWVNLDGTTGRVVGNKAFIDQSVRRQVDVAVTTDGTHDAGAIGATYDPDAQRIVMTSDVAVRGGSIQLFGQIINTAGGGAGGTGKLAVLDGFGQIAVNNRSSLPVELKSIDTGADPDPARPGRGTVGRIDITDVQYIGPAGDQNLHAIHTVISRDRDVVTVDQTGAWNADGSFCPACTTTGYAVDQNSASRVQSDSARTGAYNPQAGLRYVFTTGQDSVTQYTWQFSGASFFGTSALALPPDNVSKTLTSGPNYLPGRLLENGTYLSYLAPAGTTPHLNNLSPDVAMTSTAGATSATGHATHSKTYTIDDSFYKVAEWNKCNWWTLCIASRWTSIWTETKGQTTIKTNSVKADYPIQIEFMGANSAGLTIESPHAEVAIGTQRTLGNRYGDTSITAPSISAGAGALIDTRNATLTATDGSVGAVGAPVNLRISGALTASATHGNVVANQIAGPMKVATVSAAGTPSTDPALNQGLVRLTAQDDIYGDAGNLVSAARIELASATGAIGGIAGRAGAHPPLNLAPGYTPDRGAQSLYGVEAAAAGDIGIDVVASATRNPDGHLLADTIVSRGGDVRVSAPGMILDNNPVQSIDSRQWNQLLNYWDKLGLVGGDASNAAKVEQAIVAHENTRSQDYFQYWQIRDRQNAPAVYDPAWRYTASAAERDTLVARGQDVATFERNRTDRYWALNTQIGTYDANVFARSADAAAVRQAHPTWTQAQVDAQVLAHEAAGLLPAVAVPGGQVVDFSYVASAAERQPYTDTGSWTTAQLSLAINPGLLKDITDTNPVVKAPNVSGRNVTLVAGQSIGTTLPASDPAAVFIPYDTDGNVGEAAKIALATAEYNDFQLDVTDHGKLGLRIAQRLPVNFSATTGLGATVRQDGDSAGALTAHQFGTDLGNAYLASLGNGLVDDITIDGELRLKVKGPISAVDPARVAIQAGDAILEASGSTIGGDTAATLPLHVNLRRDSAATADSYGSITARAAGTVHIAGSDDVTVGGIFSRDAVRLVSESGSIRDAHPGTGLDILGASVELGAPFGSIGDVLAGLPLSVGTNIGSPLIGLIEALAGDSVYLNGPAGGPVSSNFWIGPVVSGHAAIAAGNTIRLTATDDAVINGDVVAVGPVEMSIGGRLTISSQRDLVVDDRSSPTGKRTVTVPAAHIGVTGVGALIHADELVMEDGATLAADLGTIAITTRGDAVVTGVSTGNGTESAISITSTGGRILGGHAPGSGHLDVIADTLPAARLTMSAALGIGDEPLNLRVLSLRATSGGVVDLAVVDSVDIDTVTADGRIQITAGGDITGRSVTSTRAAAGSDPANPFTGVALRSTGGSVGVESVAGAGDVNVAALTTVQVGTVTADGSVRLDAGGDISAGSIASTGAAAGGDPAHPAGRVALASTGGGLSVTSLSGAGEVDLAALGSVGFGDVSAGGRIGVIAGGDVRGHGITTTGAAAGGDPAHPMNGLALESTGGSISVDRVAGAGDVNVAALTRVNIGAVTADGSVQVTAGGDITGGSVTSTGAAAGSDAAHPAGRVALTSTGGGLNLGSVTGAGDLDLAALTSVDFGDVSAGARIDVNAGGDIRGHSATATGAAAGGDPAHPMTGMALRSTGGSVGVESVAGAGDVNVAALTRVNIGAVTADGSVQVTAGGDITGGSVTSTGAAAGSDPAHPAGRVALTSTGGSVGLDSVTSAGDVNIAALSALNVDQIDVGGALSLAGRLIDAGVAATGDAQHGGSIGGYGGGPAASVKLDLRTPTSFRFASFAATDAVVNVPLGEFWSDSTLILQRMILTNPQTRLLVDQTSLSPQGFDVQLYSGGPSFNLGLVTNHVHTDILAVWRGIDHEVLSPHGNDTSSAEVADAAFRNYWDTIGRTQVRIPTGEDEEQTVEYEYPAVESSD